MQEANEKTPDQVRRKKLRDCWYGMMRRCYLPTHRCFKWYGKRGIRVCKEWIDSFARFESWAIANGWSAELEIDRRDNDGNYEPGNCRFVTHRENQANKGSSKRKPPGMAGMPGNKTHSRFKGVKLNSRRSAWQSRIAFNRREIHLGSFVSEIAAAETYDWASRFLFGSSAVVNFADRDGQPPHQVVIDRLQAAMQLVATP